MKCLIVVPFFPPQKGVGTIRMASLARYLKSQSIETVVLTNQIQCNPEINLKYYYVELLKDDQSYYTRFNENQRRYNLQFCKVIEEDVPDIVIISGGPFYTFNLAVTAKKYGLPCVLDFRDPWIFEYRGFRSFFTLKNIISKLIELPWERNAVKSASKVVTVTNGWEKKFEKFYLSCRNKFEVIENGYDDYLLSGIELKENNPKDRLRIAAFGKLFYYTEKYSRIFLEAYKEFQSDIELFQVGQIENNTESLLEEYSIEKNNFKSTGFIPYVEGIQELSKADAYLIIDIRKDAIGTKIYDYIFLNKPIIYVGPKNTVIANIVSTFEKGFVCSKSKEVEKVLRMIQHGQKLSNKYDVRKYARSEQNQKWLELLKKLIDDNEST